MIHPALKVGHKRYDILALVSLMIFSPGCQKERHLLTNEMSCVKDVDVLSDFINPQGLRFQILANGKAYRITDDHCQLEADMFDPRFHDEHYHPTDSGIQIIADQYLISPQIQFLQRFEGTDHLLDYFILQPGEVQTDHLFTSLTLQSPSSYTVAEYVDLQHCIFAQSCDFKDSRVDLVSDPVDPSNRVLQFTAVGPSGGGDISKTSVSTDLAYFLPQQDFWFAAKYYVSEGLPLTIADFECSHITGYPGPRLIIQNNQLAIENKFSSKIEYRQPIDRAVFFPTAQWVRVKVHLSYDTHSGIIEVWQDDQLIIDTTGPTVPFDLWIHNRVEIGISATHGRAVMYMDDVRFGPEDF